jgi:hypothetical protein
MSLLGGKRLSVEDHRRLLEEAGYTDVEVSEERGEGWIAALGKSPAAVSAEFAASER